MSVTRGCLASTGIALCVLLAACSGSTVSDNPIPPGPQCSASAFAPPPSSPPSPGLDGRVIDVALAHNALAYDACRNVYYASIPASQPSGNSIATIDPNTGQVSFSPPIGSEPNALAMAADASVLYVGLDGTGDVVKLALPSMTEQGRTQLLSGTYAETIAVSPTDPTVAAVSMKVPNIDPGHAGVALLRGMVMQPRRTQSHTGSNLVAFDSSGGTLYGLETRGESALRKIQVLADGLQEQFMLPAATRASLRYSLAFVNGQVVAAQSLHDAASLLPLGVVSGAADCLRSRIGNLLACLDSNRLDQEARLLLADPDTFAVQASLLFATNDQEPRRLVEGPSGQVAISYPALISPLQSQILLFSSPHLLALPNPPAPSWPVAPFSTPDGQGLGIGIVHNALLYDSTRNLYYASVPGTVIGAGNSIATIDPATGRVTHSPTIGSDPNALAIAADGSALYVGLDGTGEVVKLALPSMTQQGRLRLILDPRWGLRRANAIAVSPADPSVAAVSMAGSGIASSDHAGVALLRNMALQPVRTSELNFNNLVVFNPTGTILYGLNMGSTEFGLRANQVLPDGLVEQSVIAGAATSFGRALSLSNDRVIAGSALYDAPAFAAVGRVTGESNCIRQRSPAQLACLTIADFFKPEVRILLADPASFVLRASLLLAASEPPDQLKRTFVEGPNGQVAVSYSAYAAFSASPQSQIRLFSSPHLLAPPTPPAPSWPVTPFSTPDGQGLDIGIVHNALRYDSTRNLYYASIPGSVIGAGNTIATIDPATGQVTHSPTIGSDPNALAIAADGSVLYAALDGSGEILRLALPSMTEQSRVRLPVDPFSGQLRVREIAVSPADPNVAAVSIANSLVGVTLLHNMAVQPRLGPLNNLLAFDAAGTTLYEGTTPLLASQVLADGLALKFFASVSAGFGQRSLAFANNRVIAGPGIYNASLTAGDAIAGASDCWPDRSGNLVLCFGNAIGEGRVLVASATTFTVGASLVYATSEFFSPPRLLQGPSGQVAVSYMPFLSSPPTIRLFTSAQLP